MARLALAVSALLAVAVHAQSSTSGLSSQCQNALLGIAGSPEASCLNVGGLIPLLTAADNTSLVAPINSWLQGACAQDPCSNQTLSDIVTNITTGCTNDLGSLGISGSDTPSIIASIQLAYPTVRSIACLKVSSNNTLCVTNLLTQIQGITGSLSVSNIVQELPQLVMGQASGIPSSIACSDCVKQAYNVLKQDQPELATATDVTSALQSECGTSFLDGTTPSAIAEGTGSAAPSGSGTANGAASFVSGNAVVGVALSSLTAVFSAFLVLA